MHAFGGAHDCNFRGTMCSIQWQRLHTERDFADFGLVPFLHFLHPHASLSHYPEMLGMVISIPKHILLSASAQFTTRVWKTRWRSDMMRWSPPLEILQMDCCVALLPPVSMFQRSDAPEK